jgi:hypothetical protein
MCAESSVEVMQAREKLESVRNAGVTPDPELNQHRSNSVSCHTLFGDASKTGARCAFGTKDSGAHYVYGVGTEEKA